MKEMHLNWAGEALTAVLMIYSKTNLSSRGKAEQMIPFL